MGPQQGVHSVHKARENAQEGLVKDTVEFFIVGIICGVPQFLQEGVRPLVAGNLPQFVPICFNLVQVLDTQVHVAEHVVVLDFIGIGQGGVHLLQRSVRLAQFDGLVVPYHQQPENEEGKHAQNYDGKGQRGLFLALGPQGCFNNDVLHARGTDDLALEVAGVHILQVKGDVSACPLVVSIFIERQGQFVERQEVTVRGLEVIDGAFGQPGFLLSISPVMPYSMAML